MRFQGIPVVGGRGDGPVWIPPSRNNEGSRPLHIGEAPPGAVIVAPRFPDRFQTSDPSRKSIVSGIIVEEELSRADASGFALPVVAGLDVDLFRPGEHVDVNGNDGGVAVEGLREIRVVTSFLQDSQGKILLLHRSSRVGSFAGRWAAVSGFLETDSPLEQALQEIREETGIAVPDLRLVSFRGRPVYARDGERVFSVHPFLFQATSTRVQLDWEHTEFKWVDPLEMGRFETVPKLDRVWRALQFARAADVPKNG